jgi:hypothetical protein
VSRKHETGLPGMKNPENYTAAGIFPHRTQRVSGHGPPRTAPRTPAAAALSPPAGRLVKQRKILYADLSYHS